jgi:hypothetical protein
MFFEIKCFTKVVELGLNKVKEPEQDWSATFPYYLEIN